MLNRARPSISAAASAGDGNDQNGDRVAHEHNPDQEPKPFNGLYLATGSEVDIGHAYTARGGTVQDDPRRRLRNQCASREP